MVCVTAPGQMPSYSIIIFWRNPRSKTKTEPIFRLANVEQFHGFAMWEMQSYEQMFIENCCCYFPILRL